MVPRHGREDMILSYEPAKGSTDISKESSSSFFMSRRLSRDGFDNPVAAINLVAAHSYPIFYAP